MNFRNFLRIVSIACVFAFGGFFSADAAYTCTQCYTGCNNGYGYVSTAGASGNTKYTTSVTVVAGCAQCLACNSTNNYGNTTNGTGGTGTGDCTLQCTNQCSNTTNNIVGNSCSQSTTGGTKYGAYTCSATSGSTCESGSYSSSTGSANSYSSKSCQCTTSACNYASVSCSEPYIQNGSALECTGKVYTITLTRNSGTQVVYQKYASGYSASKTNDYTIGTTITTVAAPTKTGYAFQGYYTGTAEQTLASGGTCTGTQRITSAGALPASTTFTAATTLYACWKASTYTITFNKSSGTGTTAGTGVTDSGGTTATMTAETGVSLTYPTVGTLVRDGRVFNGWGTSGCTSGSTSGSAHTGATTLYACWNPCADGYYKVSGAAGGTACTACAVGSRSNATTASTGCTACGNGKTTAGTGTGNAGTCTDCSAIANLSTWATASWSANSVSGLCQVGNCAAGSYKANTTTCTICAAGSYSSAGATSCTVCTAGTGNNTGTAITDHDASGDCSTCPNTTAAGINTWTMPTWAANSVTNRCTISACYTGYTLGGTGSSTTCTGVALTATYSCGTGTGTAPTTGGWNYGDTKTAAAQGSCSRSGFAFGGWTCTGGNTSCDGDVIAAGGSISTTRNTAGAITLTAVWGANTYTMSYACDGASVGGTPPSNESKTGGTDYTLSASVPCTRTGYVQIGWKTGATTFDGTGKITTYSTEAAVQFHPVFTTCPAGQYWNGSACTAVGDRYYSPANDTARYDCITEAGSNYANSDGTRAAKSDCYMNVAAKKFVGTKNSNTPDDCSNGYYKAAHTYHYDAAAETCATQCTNKPAATGCDSSSYESAGTTATDCTWKVVVSTGKYWTGSVCTACGAASYQNGARDVTTTTANTCTGSCPTQSSGWTADTTTGKTLATQCYQTRTAASVDADCTAGTLTQYASNDTTWATTMTAASVSATGGTHATSGSMAATTTDVCPACGNNTWYAGGTATTCTTCAAPFNSGSDGARSAQTNCFAQSSTNAGALGNYWTGSAFAACANGSFCPNPDNTKIYYNTTAATGTTLCSSLSGGAAPTGGTYASDGTRNANTTCLYTAPAITSPTNCYNATSPANQVRYSGTAWPTTTYSVSAKKGAFVSANNVASPTCTVCPADKYQDTDGYTGNSCPSTCISGYGITGTVLTDHDSYADCSKTCGAGTYLSTNTTATCEDVLDGHYKVGSTTVYQTSTTVGSTIARSDCNANYPHSAGGRDEQKDCYKDTTLNKNGGSGTISIPAGNSTTGAAQDYTGTTNAVLRCFETVACTMPNPTLTRNNSASGDTWCTGDGLNDVFGTCVADGATLAPTSTNTTLLAKWTCNGGYYETAATACTTVTATDGSASWSAAGTNVQTACPTDYKRGIQDGPDTGTIVGDSQSDCFTICASGNYVATANNACVVDPANKYSMYSGTNGRVNYGSTTTTGTTGGADEGKLHTCATGYTTRGATADYHDERGDCVLTTTAGKYVASADAAETTCAIGGYCPGGVNVRMGSYTSMTGAVAPTWNNALADTTVAGSFGITYTITGDGTKGVGGIVDCPNNASTCSGTTATTIGITGATTKDQCCKDVTRPVDHGVGYGRCYYDGAGSLDTNFRTSCGGQFATCFGGYYLAANATDACSECGQGFYCEGETQYGVPNAAIQGRAACSPANKYQDETKQVSCKTVSPGYYKQDDTAQIICETTHYCPGTGYALACPTGYGTVASIATAIDDCVKGESATGCASGARTCYVPAATTAPAAADGTYKKKYATQPTFTKQCSAWAGLSAPANWYISNATGDPAACSACASPYTISLGGSIDIHGCYKDCAAGQYWTGSACQDCEASTGSGTYCLGGNFYNTSASGAGKTNCPATHKNSDLANPAQATCWTECAKPGHAETMSGKDFYSAADTCAIATCEDGYTLSGGTCTTKTNYTITYNRFGGSTGGVANYNVETATITLYTPTRAHSAFDGWYDNSSYAGYPTATIPLGSTGNKEFWAKWSCDAGYHKVDAGTASETCVANAYTVSYHLNAPYGGSGTMPNSACDYDTPCVPNANTFSRPGFTFIGWATGAANAATIGDGCAFTIAGDTDLYARWYVAAPSIKTASTSALLSPQLKQTEHALGIRVGSTTYYGNLVESNIPGKLKIKSNGIIYSVIDDPDGIPLTCP